MEVVVKRPSPVAFSWDLGYWGGMAGGLVARLRGVAGQRPSLGQTKGLQGGGHGLAGVSKMAWCPEGTGPPQSFVKFWMHFQISV